MLDFISIPMGWILSQLSTLFNNNFAASVLVFTILVNIVMLPLTINSLKSTAKQARIKHKLDALKKKCGDDRQKYSEGMQELYNKEGISMGGGCLPMIIRLIIMMGVYYAISSPFTYVVNVDSKALNAAKQWTAYVKVAEATDGKNVVSAKQWESLGLKERTERQDIIVLAAENGGDVEHYAKLSILHDVYSTSDKKLAKNSVEKTVKGYVTNTKSAMREVEIANLLNKQHEDYEPMVEKVFVANSNEQELVKLSGGEKAIDFMLFNKIDLRDTPKFSFKIFEDAQLNWLIPIASFVASIMTGVLSSVLQKKNNPEAPSMMAMMLIMPLFSLYIAFGFPCAVGFYWACSSLVSGGIQLITQVVYGPQAVNAREQAKKIVLRGKAEKERMSRFDNAVEE